MSLEQILSDLDVKKTPQLDVAIAIDTSGSMDEEFKDGTVAKIFEYLTKFGSLLDDDKKFEIIGFNTKASTISSIRLIDGKVELTKLNEKDEKEIVLFDNISDFIAKTYRAGGGTNYAGAISGLLEKLDHNLPSILFVVTDGANGDEKETREVLTKASTENPTKYVHFIRAGIDALDIQFIKDVAGELKNVGYSDLANPRASEEDFYKSVITNELASFLNSQVS